MEQEALHPEMIEALRRGDEAVLEELARKAGFAEPRKSATNLALLQELLQDAEGVAELARQALDTAEADLALNSLERLGTTVGAEGLRPALAQDRQRTQLLTVLGASPFLSGILCRKRRYLEDLFSGGEIERSKTEEEMLAELRGLIPAEASFAELQQGLRRYKAREILRIGSRDLCGQADLVEVTCELSALAAATLQRAYEISDGLLRAEYGVPLEDAPEGQDPTEAQFTVLGMGKFGGRELNFSSDIDLIYFYSSERGRTTGVAGPRGETKNRIALHVYFGKLAEMLTKAIGEATADGFVFRVDLRLRPEGNSGEMVISLRSAEVYYESWGHSWERAAMLKARPVAGSIALGERLLNNLAPFIYRRHLDYGMVEDIKQMKQKVDHSLAREREGERNLKLGRGGIREIEFFIQALQLIYAGKNAALRQRNSLKALDLLAGEGLIGEPERDVLREAYIFLRTAEHRIQVVQERQTHNLPTRPEELLALARRCGFADREGFDRALQHHREGVQEIYRQLFYTSEEELREQLRPEIAFLFASDADSDLVKDVLEEKGFKNPDGAYESLLSLRDGPSHTHLTQRSRRHLERIAPLLMQEVIDCPEPDMALSNIERFISASGARGTFYALLAENREIIKVLVGLFGTSQFLSRIFIQHPEILDSLVSRAYAVDFKDREAMRADLADQMTAANCYEDKLIALRRFRNEEFLRIALNDVHGHMPQGQGTIQLSSLADVCLEAAIAIAREELIPRFGLPFCDAEGAEAGFAIVGMGKLGGMELNYHSDLDIIFVYRGEGKTRPAEGTDPDRFRPLTNPEYFSRLAQRIISVLTLVTREGSVYEIDTRLRPSGNQGPLVTSLAAYQRYHDSSAQLWERQALTKARVVTGPADLVRQIDEVNHRIVYDRPLPSNLREEIGRLRSRMEQEIAREGKDHFNIKTGRGGMVDVEFLTQYLQLLHGCSHPSLRGTNTLETLEHLREEGLLAPADQEVLTEGYEFLRRLENKLRLVHDQSISQLSGEAGYLGKLAHRLGYKQPPKVAAEAFLADYRATTENIRTIFSRTFGQAD